MTEPYKMWKLESIKTWRLRNSIEVPEVYMKATVQIGALLYIIGLILGGIFGYLLRAGYILNGVF